MQLKYLWLFFIGSLSFSTLSHGKAEDFFRLSRGGLLISGIEMKRSEVMTMIQQEKKWKRIGHNRYILNGSVGGEFDVQLKFSNGQLTEIVAKQVGRMDYR